MTRFATLFLLTVLLGALAAPRAQDPAGSAAATLPMTGTVNAIYTEPGTGGGLPIIVGDGAGFVEVTNPAQDPCPDPGDAGCDLGLGNTVYNDPNVTDDYYFSSNSTGEVTRLYRYIESLNGDDIEIRWTEEGGYGLEFGAPGTFGGPGTSGATVIHVPFELWALGDSLGGPDDDVRMIPHLLLDTGGTGAPDSILVTDWTTMNAFVGFADDGSGLPATNPIYMMMPDRADGYDLFEAAALASGGAGAAYVDTDTDVTPIDSTHLDVGDVSVASGSDCAHQGGYVSWCYRNDTFSGTPDVPNEYTSYFGIGDPVLDPNLLFVYPIGRTQVVDNNPSTVAVEPPAGLPGVATLLPVYPNPFGDRAAVAYTLPAPARVRLAVYDVLGREVALLADGDAAAGRHEVALSGSGFPPGLYVVRLEVDGTTVGARKALLMR